MSASPTPLPSPAPARPRRRWLKILLVLLVFFAGAVVGAGLGVVAVVHRVRMFIEHPERTPAMFTERLKKRLDLTDAQADQVLHILESHEKQLEAIRVEVRPQVEAQLAGARREISALLDDHQRLLWDEMYERLHRSLLPPLPPGPSP